MLPQPARPEIGSRKVLNGKEFFTIHNFTTEKGNVLETVGGDYILPNGESVKDRSILECLPDQHKQKALAWWNSQYGEMTKPVQETPESIRAQIEVLSKKLSVMEEGETESSPLEPDVKDSKEVKSSGWKVKGNKGVEALKQMGISG